MAVKNSGGIANVMEAVEPGVSLALKLSGALTLLCLLYVIYGVGFGSVSKLAQYSAAYQNQAVSIMRLVCHLWLLGSVVLALSLLLWNTESGELGGYLALMGAAYYFGMPMLVGVLVSRAGGAANPATEAVVAAARSAGLGVLALAGIRILFSCVAAVRNRPLVKADVGIAEKAKVAASTKVRRMHGMSPCWDLPYCRESIKQNCPAFIARKRCWKFGRGCYCDEDMIAAIVRGTSGLGDSKSRGQAQAFMRSSMPERTKKKKAPCARCYIFIEHQNLKHKLLSPFMPLVTALLIYMLYPLYVGVYDHVAEASLHTVKQLAAAVAAPQATNQARPAQPTAAATRGPNPSSGAPDVERDITAAGTRTLILVILGFFMLIYVTRFMEFCIYKLHF